jgi:hypothetical protein
LPPHDAREALAALAGRGPLQPDRDRAVGHGVGQVADRRKGLRAEDLELDLPPHLFCSPWQRLSATAGGLDGTISKQ